MTREQIKSAASEAALRMMFRSDIHPSQQGEALFIDGAQWRINSVWHDVNERPKFPGKVECVKFLLLRKNGECDRYLIGKYNWDDIIDMEKPIKWAYIDDLLPERKEKEVRDIQKSCYFRRGEPVLVRDYGGDWKIKAFTKMQDGYCKYGATTDGLDECGYRQCIPYNERTMHLLGTSEDYKEESK